jgi:uncharacterized protein (TIGR03437 family)
MRAKAICTAILAVLPITLFAFSSGPPVKRTGGVDGNLNCTACHQTFAPANSDPRGSVSIENLQPYVPGAAQTLRVTVSHPEASRWGFQLTARFVNGGGNLKAGTFTPANAETKVVCDNGTLTGSAGPCFDDQLEWIEHADAPRTAPGEGKTFEFQWTPPMDENGDIMFFVAGNAANGNNQPVDDRIYTATARVSLSASATCSIIQRPLVRNVVNAGPHAGAFSWNSMVEIYGSGFSAPSRTRSAGPGDFAGGVFPTSLACIGVVIAGQRVPVTYVQENQINVQAPTTTTTGPVTVVVIGNPGRANEIHSDPANVTMNPVAPAFFTLGATQSIAAQFAGTADTVADPAVVPGARPARPGEVITLYGTGFGNTDPVWRAGELPTAAASLIEPFTVSIGGTMLPASDILYAGLSPQSISALFQFNVRVPASAPDGDLTVVITISGVSTQAGATIPVRSTEPAGNGAQ